jgi:hypothetical protein
MSIIFCNEISFRAALTGALFITSISLGFASEINVVLSGEEEVPPVRTTAVGESNIKVTSDTSISGKVTTKGFEGVAAHIHEGPPGKNGPIIITLKKISAKSWEVPPQSRLTESQFASFKAGNLYLNIHSAVNQSGEIRGQITENRLSHNVIK